MADIATHPLVAPRMPWRTMVMALLVIALLLATALAYVGSQQPRVPAPFGPARNGLLTYAAYGDIYTADPATGTATAVVAGKDTVDTNPVFSRDGTRLAFLRRSTAGAGFDLVVADADGTNARVVSASPIEGYDAATDPDFEWAPDSRSLIVYAEPRILRLDAVGSAAPVVISEKAVPTGRLGPTGLIPYQPLFVAEDAVWTLGLDGAAPKELIRNDGVPNGSFGRVRFSPDGKLLAFHENQRDYEGRIFVSNADGTGARRLTNLTGLGHEVDFAWSPDGTQIAFVRWTPDDPANPDGDWSSPPIGIASVDGGAAGSPVIVAENLSSSTGLVLDWSPDGSSIVAMPHGQGVVLAPPRVIDVATGQSHELDLTAASLPNWQRLAP